MAVLIVNRKTEVVKTEVAKSEVQTDQNAIMDQSATGLNGVVGQTVSEAKYQTASKFESENAIVRINVPEQVLKRVPVPVPNVIQTMHLLNVTINHHVIQNHHVVKIRLAQQQLLLL